MSVLELRRVSKVYGEGPTEVQALRDVDLSVDAGALVAVMGPSGSGPGSSGCVPGSCVANPTIQTLNRLPTETSGPNLLITSYGMRKLGKLGLRAVPSAWLIQTARPLTSVQINAARQIAVAAGATIETRSQSPSLAELRSWATAAGILLALGVLAMTVGLIRSATAGALCLLGALLGTAVAYLAAIAWYRSSLGTTISHVPVDDLIVVVVGLPLAATIGGWLLAGREPPGAPRS